jgi:type I restriction enzyme, S subunit
MVALNDITKFVDYRGKTPTKTKDGIPLITAKNVKFGFINQEPREYIAEDDYNIWMTRGIPQKGDVLITTEAPLGNVAQIHTDKKIALAQRIITLIPQRDKLVDAFLCYLLLTDYMQNQISSKRTGSTVYGIKAKTLKQITIPVPSLSIQQEIVNQIEAEKDMVSASKKLIDIFEQKITDKIGEVWGE